VQHHKSRIDLWGTPIGPNDLMIASIALSKKLTLITANANEFGRVVGLSMANWEIEDS
jgi:tRNA(fMet)-specific endonuclease VapC